jgi:hypothetical protein
MLSLRCTLHASLRAWFTIFSCLAPLAVGRLIVISGVILAEGWSFFWYRTATVYITLAYVAAGTGSFYSARHQSVLQIFCGSDHFSLRGPFFFRSGENATVSLPTLSVSYQ